MSNSYDAPGRRGDVPLAVAGRRILRKTLWSCADGFVTWNLWTGPGMGRKNEPIFQWMRDEGVPEAADLLSLPWEKMSTSDLSADLLERVNRSVGDFFAQRSKALIDREALERRILFFAIRSLKDVAQDEQLHERGAFGPFELPGGQRVRVVATPVRSSAYPVEIAGRAPAWGADSEAVRRDWLGQTRVALASEGAPVGSLPFEGIRVLDFGWLVVSPLTYEDPGDLRRRRREARVSGSPRRAAHDGAVPVGQALHGRERPLVSINAGKRSLGVDINHPDARKLIHRMAREADVICENFTPGTASRLGYAYEDFRAVVPDVIMMSLSMQGQTGARATQPGLGNHLQAMSGLDYVTGYPEGNPQDPTRSCRLHRTRDCRHPPCSPPSSTDAAAARAVHRHLQLEAMMLYMQPGLIQYGVSGASPERRGNASLSAAPHGVYPVRGEDRWIAIGRPQRRRVAPAARNAAGVGAQGPFRRSVHTGAAGAPLGTRRRAGPVERGLGRGGARNRASGAECPGPTPSATVGTSSPIRSSASASTTASRSTANSGPSLVDAPAFRISSVEPRIDAGTPVRR